MHKGDGTMIEKLPKMREYFGAMNSYKGFKSYFDEIFDPKNFDRIYVIKGGPGCGKSSFMKRIVSLFGEKYDTDAIYCSSDPHSLDGVIIYGEKKRIAFLDGTAPHETDAKIPGAVYKLLPFSDFWDDGWLIAERDKITSLCIEKAKEYSIAYSFLRLAGEADSSIISLYEKEYDAGSLKQKASELFATLQLNERGRSTSRITTAFCKDEVKRLKNDVPTSAKKLSINLPYYLFRIFSQQFEDIIDSLGIKNTRFITAPEKITEGFYFPEKNIYIGRDEGESIEFDEGFFRQNPLMNERTKGFEQIKRRATEEAVRHLGIASGIHFELEEIYKRAMDFDKLNEFFDKTAEECKIFLEKD